MADYKQLRSSSPTAGRWLSGDLELKESHVKEQLNLQDEQQEGLLSEEDGRENDAKPKSWRTDWKRGNLLCRIGLFGLASLIIIAVAGLILRWLYLREQEGKLTRTFRRPSSDYVIDPNWNYNAAPTTREYHWTITDIIANPDGVFRPMVVINDQFPGPMITCNEGDTIVVNVVNMATNATSIHWHGIFQNDTNWNDGTVGVTQCPIAPGRGYRYEFTVKGQAGSYFYHGHHAAQGLDGLVGPLIILSKDDKENQPAYSTDRVVMVQDWYHDLSDGLLRDTLSPGNEGSPIPNGALINGLNTVDCSSHPNRICDNSTTTIPTFDLAPYEQHRLRFVNVGGFAWFEVSVDNHLSLPVSEVDGVNVEPKADSTVLIGPGQRYSVILSANQTEAQLFWFRARMLNHCFSENVLPDHGVTTAQAVIRYNSTGPATKHDGELVLPTTENDSGKFTVICQDKAPGTYVPIPAQPAPEYAHHSWHLRVNLEIGNWRLERGFLNQSTFRPNIKWPTLHRAIDGFATGNETFDVEGVNEKAFDKKNELVVSSKTIEVVDIILQNFDEGNHPLHLHGMQMYILAAGHGYFPGYEKLGLKPGGKGLLDASNNSIVANPMRRDVTTVEGYGWTLIRFVADNPGVWLFHCHMIWHGEAGMAMQFMSRTDVMKNWTIPAHSAELCNAPIDELEKGSAPKDSIWFGHFGST